MGCLNNIPYVIMLAVAKNISEGGTALVFLANIVPGLFIKLSAPYWFDRVTYTNRIAAGSFLMCGSFIFVGLFAKNKENEEKYKENEENIIGVDIIMQLIGVALCSAQGSLGEASLLALAGKFDSSLHFRPVTSVHLYEDNDHEEYLNTGGENNINSETSGKGYCIVALSSGTGIAGIFGFGYVFFLMNTFGMNLTKTLLVALIFPILYWIIYKKYLADDDIDLDFHENNSVNVSTQSECNSTEAISDHLLATEVVYKNLDNECKRYEHNLTVRVIPKNLRQKSTLANKKQLNPSTKIKEEKLSYCNVSEEGPSSCAIQKMTCQERLKLNLSLWPYTVPLFTVYFAEYVLLSGIWTAIGFPLENEVARNKFYVASNWTVRLQKLALFILFCMKTVLRILLLNITHFYDYLYFFISFEVCCLSLSSHLERL